VFQFCTISDDVPLKLPESPTRLDLDDMRRRLGADDDLLADLLGLFLEDCPATLSALEKAVQAVDAEGTRRGAHSLKGSASNMSAHAVVASAAALEAAASDRRTEAFAPLFAKLRSDIAELEAELNGGIPERAS
jgi:HPt (histidine-containing phosphotransfer) domain-containing protein